MSTVNWNSEQLRRLRELEDKVHRFLVKKNLMTPLFKDALFELRVCSIPRDRDHKIPPLKKRMTDEHKKQNETKTRSDPQLRVLGVLHDMSRATLGDVFLVELCEEHFKPLEKEL